MQYLWLQYLGDEEGVTLKVFSYSNWDENLNSKRSITRFAFILTNTTISWVSKKQPIVALSSTKVKYMATPSTIREAMWLKKLL